uniref:Protein kinase domain-containing protein n=1 Tax=Mucochytrium quahogii TaxID=96639 RepID=A0A7S2WSW6_9STRA|mmetsp:Transcript_949/g.1906  ORF Transcript_949/g.1906 Transcript_949/m.1906 type:complete len:752 (+) Transcript_949:20-2275(+)
MDKENVLPNDQVDDERLDLLKRALDAKGSTAQQRFDLLQHDSSKLVHLSPEMGVKTQMGYLERDTSGLSKSSYMTLKMWLSLADFIEKKSVSKCVRMVYERMYELGVGKYYIDFYESWGCFEIRADGLDRARAVVGLAFRNKAANEKETSEEQLLKAWEASTSDSDETIAFQKGMTRNSGGKTDPTITLGNRRGVLRKGVAKKTALRASSNLSRIGGPAKRVVLKVEEEEDKKKKILEKIGDVSYIKNWTPNGSPEQKRVSMSSSSTEEAPTETFNPAKVTAEEETIEFRPKTMRVPPLVENFSHSLFSPKNLFIVNGKPYIRLALIGRGGSSKVFKVLALQESEPQIYAMKRIKLTRTDKSSIASFVNEISLLERLRGNSNIIRLHDSEVDLEKKVIYMVMEHGEVDLNTMLQRGRASKTLSVNFIRLTWMNMLEAVHAIHEERIVHGDLKPANFLFVKGKLKLIDFGIAKAISCDTTNIMRDTQVGTLNYMSPEAIIDTNSAAGSRPKIGAPGMKLKQGRASDIWSMGCILYQMIYGHTPFHELKLIQKIHCISDPNYKIAFPPLEVANPDLLDVVKSCLQFDPQLRPPIVGGLLEHAFLNPRGAPTYNMHVFKKILVHVAENGEQLLKLRNTNCSKFDEVAGSLGKFLFSSNEEGKKVGEIIAPRKAIIPTEPPIKSELKSSILAGKANLQPVHLSKSNKYMKEKGDSPDKGLVSLLRAGLEKKREHLESQEHTIEATIRSGTTWEFR